MDRSTSFVSLICWAHTYQQTTGWLLTCIAFIPAPSTCTNTSAAWIYLHYNMMKLWVFLLYAYIWSAWGYRAQNWNFLYVHKFCILTPKNHCTKRQSRETWGTQLLWKRQSQVRGSLITVDVISWGGGGVQRGTRFFLDYSILKDFQTFSMHAKLL